MVDGNFTSFYPLNWPANPFHAGEVKVQKRLGVESHVNSYAPRVVRPFLPDQHRDFFTSQPFLVVAGRDERDMLWSTLLFASDPNKVSSFVTSPDPTSLLLEALPLVGDALERGFQPGSDLGILAIEFATRRRNRVNGRILRNNDGKSMTFKVDQSFGNCPQYIKPRDWWTSSVPNNEGRGNDNSVESTCRLDRLTIAQIKEVRTAETIFVATGYRGEGEDPRYGNDASHRGGQAGFIEVDEGGTKLRLPEYSGNNHFNTIGNLLVDSRMGITIPLYGSGGVIQLSGTASVIWDEEDDVISKYPGAQRLIEFNVLEVVDLPPGSLPIRWNSGNDGLKLQVSHKEEESNDVTSFYLSAVGVGGEDSRLPPYKPGQHLSITLPADRGRNIVRSYSLSSYDSKQTHYRISVKRDPFGLGSKFLHDNMQVGDIVGVEKPSGDFVYNPSSASGKVVFMSAGIGVTPTLSMLHSFIENSMPTQKAVWIHSARNGKYHPFQDEIEKLALLAKARLRIIVTYTRPTADDSSGFNFTGRIDRDVLAAAIEPGEKDIDVYMCGPNSFVSEMSIELENTGIDNRRIQSESF
jgi:ferredoxin-NADP reductase/predicted pyridoxine 5'-phosphate oxidase superfamily flavin-nucleotide-binding protein